MEIYSRYNPNPSKDYYVEVSSGRTQQQFKDECDINLIVSRVMQGGTLLPQDINPNSPIFGDFSQVTDFMTAMNVINSAASDFNALDPRIRARFNNNPAELLDFLCHEENRSEAIQLGFISAPEPAPEPAPVV